VGRLAGKLGRAAQSDGPLEYLVAHFEMADSRHMKAYSGSTVAVVIPISVVIPVPAAVHVEAPVSPVAVGIPISVVIPVHVDTAPVSAVAVVIPISLRAGRARKQHRGSQGRHGCSK
jgi:hypothetical protein